jgi:hypothetical protein
MERCCERKEEWCDFVLGELENSHSNASLSLMDVKLRRSMDGLRERPGK